MPGNKYDRLDSKHITEGRFEEVMRERTVLGDGNVPVTSNFLRYVILEVISDPTTLDSSKLSHYEHDLGVSNIAMASVAPRNSVIARRVMGPGSSASEKVMCLYPFFPPHLAFPAKPGEHVWVMFEHPDAKESEIGYWMCRIVHPSFVEDVNYTHADRQFDKSFLPGLTDIFDGTDDPKYEFRNGVVDQKDGKRYTIGSTVSIPGDERAYETLLTQTDASRLTKYESVPRFRKRPADLALEGSNNQLIVFETDRVGAVAGYDQDPDKGRVPNPVVTDVIEDGCGAIDIVVGRGQTELTGGKEEQNTLISGGVLNKELGKSKKDLADQEGDPSFHTDRSRIYVAGRTRVDANLGLGDFNSGFSSGKIPTQGQVPPTDEVKGDGAIVVKSDKVRLIARSDVEILVTGIINRDKNGKIVEDTNTGSWACIIVKANGDIVFKPSKTGYIKLGGDDANKGIVCSDVPVTAQNGGVIGPPLTTTMGGLFAGSKPAGEDNGPALSASQAKFANKVLIK